MAKKRPKWKFVDPSEFEPDTPKRALAEFMLAWKERDWKVGVSYSQLTWQHEEKDPLTTIRNMFSIRKLLFCTFLDTRKISSVCMDIHMTITFKDIGMDIVVHDLWARVIKETAPYTPSRYGKWGVNPHVFRERRGSYKWK